MFLYRSCPGSIVYTPDEQAFVDQLHLQTYDTWDDKLPGLPRGSRKKRGELKERIKTELRRIQGDYCASLLSHS